MQSVCSVMPEVFLVDCYLSLRTMNRVIGRCLFSSLSEEALQIAVKRREAKEKRKDIPI